MEARFYVSVADNVIITDKKDVKRVTHEQKIAEVIVRLVIVAIGIFALW